MYDGGYPGGSTPSCWGRCDPGRPSWLGDGHPLDPSLLGEVRPKSPQRVEGRSLPVWFDGASILLNDTSILLNVAGHRDVLFRKDEERLARESSRATVLAVLSGDVSVRDVRPRADIGHGAYYVGAPDASCCVEF